MKTFTFCLFVTIFSISTNAQTLITGKIINDFGEELHNSHVSIKRTDVGTVSEKGRFKILAKKNDTLVISHLGYTIREVPIANKKTVAVTLEVESLEEVLISASFKCCVYRKGSCHTLSRGCRSKGVHVTILQTQEKKKNNSVLFPNPSSSGYFNIKLPNSFKEVKLNVFSIRGQLLTSSVHQHFQGTFEVDLSTYAAGMYLIQVEADGKMLPTMRALKG